MEPKQFHHRSTVDDRLGFGPKCVCGAAWLERSNRCVMTRSHSERIKANRKELADLRAQVRRFRSFVERQEARGTMPWIPLAILRELIDLPLDPDRAEDL